MKYAEVGDLDGAPIRMPADQDCRTCSVCGGDCEPDPSLSVGDTGDRIAFVCPQHGVQSVADPFDGTR